MKTRGMQVDNNLANVVYKCTSGVHFNVAKAVVCL